MNRQQAEHILDAYISMCYAADADGSSDAKKAKYSLREVILDAMTEYKQTSNPWTITYPPKPMVTYTNTADPNVVNPSVTTSSTTAEIVGYKDGIVKVVGE